MQRIAKGLLACAVLSMAVLADADAGPFRHRRACCQPENVGCCNAACEGEAGLFGYYLYVCNSSGTYAQLPNRYDTWMDAYKAGQIYKKDKDALHWAGYIANPTGMPCKKTFTIGPLPPPPISGACDLYYCENFVWCYQGTFNSCSSANSHALNAGKTERAPCPDDVGSSQPGDYTCCTVPNDVNGTACPGKAKGH
jgi:hypothetical protein